MDIFPLDQGSEASNKKALPKGKKGWILFLDEINSAPLSVQAAAYKLILDRAVGNHNLHPNVAIICAGNKMTDGAIVNRTGTAMQSRMVHFNLIVEHQLWSAWASQNNLAMEVIAYINNSPDSLHKFDPNHNDLTFPCPRTWFFASKIVMDKALPLNEKLPILAGTIGEAEARQFIIWTEVFSQIPSYQKIIANPNVVPVPDEPSMLAALSSMIGAHMTVTDIKPAMDFVNRMDLQFQIFALQDACKRRPELIKEKEIMKWINKHGDELYFN